ncbi:MAG: hypothetical protein QOG91_357 [Candidatus Parcubacteria bacterium]|jgi:hypothetical protein|nr:hypothetical protein [Candidatus Parcubacteria bacterium]
MLDYERLYREEKARRIAAEHRARSALKKLAKADWLRAIVREALFKLKSTDSEVNSIVESARKHLGR